MKATIDGILAAFAEFEKEVIAKLTELKKKITESLEELPAKSEGTGVVEKPRVSYAYKVHAQGNLTILDQIAIVASQNPGGITLNDMLVALEKRGATINARDPKKALRTYIWRCGQVGYFDSMKDSLYIISTKGEERAKELLIQTGEKPSPALAKKDLPPLVKKDPLPVLTRPAKPIRVKKSDEGISFHGEPVVEMDNLDNEIKRELEDKKLTNQPCLWKIGSVWHCWDGTGRRKAIREYYRDRRELPPHMSMPDKASMFEVDGRGFEYHPQNPRMQPEVLSFVIAESRLPPYKDLVT